MDLNLILKDAMLSFQIFILFNEEAVALLQWLLFAYIYRYMLFYCWIIFKNIYNKNEQLLAAWSKKGSPISKALILSAYQSTLKAIIKEV